MTWNNSMQEIVTFFLLMTGLQVLQQIAGRRQRVMKTGWYRQAMILILAVYFTGVCHFTLLHRDVSAGMEYELSLFWSYRYTLQSSSTSFFWEVVYNIILLSPMGVLLPLYLKKFGRFRYTVAAGFLTSCLIELSQLVFHLGLFEFDDIFNNTLGTCMGYSVYYVWACVAGSSGDGHRGWRRWGKLLALLLSDGIVVLYFWRLWRRINGGAAI